MKKTLDANSINLRSYVRPFQWKIECLSTCLWRRLSHWTLWLLVSAENIMLVQRVGCGGIGWQLEMWLSSCAWRSKKWSRSEKEEYKTDENCEMQVFVATQSYFLSLLCFINELTILWVNINIYWRLSNEDLIYYAISSLLYIFLAMTSIFCNGFEVYTKIDI